MHSQSYIGHTKAVGKCMNGAFESVEIGWFGGIPTIPFVHTPTGCRTDGRKGI